MDRPVSFAGRAGYNDAMAERQQAPRVLVTGSGFPGAGIAAALLAEGAEVDLLQRPDEAPLSEPLASSVRSLDADVWNPASLSGRARGHQLAIHTVGSMYADPARGLNHHWLNFVCARNVANMCVSDGCPRLVLLSCARAPWINRGYVRAKRAAEQYCLRVGLQTIVIRAPLTWVRGQRRQPFFWLMTLLGSIPPHHVARLWPQRAAAVRHLRARRGAHRAAAHGWPANLLAPRPAPAQQQPGSPSLHAARCTGPVSASGRRGRRPVRLAAADL